MGVIAPTKSNPPNEFQKAFSSHSMEHTFSISGIDVISHHHIEMVRGLLFGVSDVWKDSLCACLSSLSVCDDDECFNSNVWVFFCVYIKAHISIAVRLHWDRMNKWHTYQSECKYYWQIAYIAVNLCTVFMDDISNTENLIGF